MTAFALRRALILIPELFAVSLGAFLIVHLAPGNPALLLAGLHPTPALIASITREWGLNLPLPEQYLRFLVQLSHGNLGYSMMEHRPVMALIGGALPVTLTIGGGGTALALLLGIPLGVAAGRRTGSFVDRVIVLLTSITVSVPLFWLGILLVIAFSIRLGWLPSAGYGTFRQLILPWLALGINGLAIFARMMRNQLSDVLANDYIRTARAKGVAPTGTVWRHAIRNALIPIIALLGLRVGYIIAGSIVLELVFLLPGMGQLMVQAILNSDYTVVQGTMLVLGISVLVANFLADLAYGWVNPAIRYQ
jgi:ABC-type dipeptide/oligopeptide/nickel transport system permease component